MGTAALDYFCRRKHAGHRAAVCRLGAARVCCRRAAVSGVVTDTVTAGLRLPPVTGRTPFSVPTPCPAPRWCAADARTRLRAPSFGLMPAEGNMPATALRCLVLLAFVSASSRCRCCHRHRHCGLVPAAIDRSDIALVPTPCPAPLRCAAVARSRLHVGSRCRLCAACLCGRRAAGARIVTDTITADLCSAAGDRSYTVPRCRCRAWYRYSAQLMLAAVRGHRCRGLTPAEGSTPVTALRCRFVLLTFVVGEQLYLVLPQTPSLWAHVCRG